jgi:ABC-type multidrug transport system fused ATPase/permease subunit
VDTTDPGTATNTLPKPSWLESMRRAPLVRFIGFMRPHLGYTIGAALMGIGKFSLPFAFPLTFKYVLDVLLTPNPTMGPLDRFIDRLCIHLSSAFGLAATPQDKLLVLTLAMMVLYVAQAVSSYFRNCWSGIAGNRLIFDLRCALFSHLQCLPNSFFDQNSVGAISSRLVNDVEQAQQFVGSTLTDVWIDGVALALLSWFLFLLDPRLAIIALAVAPIYVAMVRYFTPRIRRTSRAIQETLEEMSGSVNERIAGAVAIKAFARERYEVDRFRKQAGQLYNCNVERVRLVSGQQMLTELITRVAPSIVVWGAAVMIMGRSMTVGTLVAFIGYLGYIYQPLEHFSQLSSVVASSLSAIERIFNLLDVAPEIRDHPLSRPLTVRRGTIEFDHASFAYRARDPKNARAALRDVTLRIPGGYRVALVGRSGAGKTTLANLIPRFYDVTAGRVLIDGRDVRHVTLKSLRENIGIVTQDTTLFDGTVRENLLYGRPDADDSAMWNALRQANLYDFFANQPAGLDTVIGARGLKLSGGQRQRLALARAFIKDPAVLILDEATSAVDSESENLIHDAMRRLMEGRTALLIAHRLRSAIDADMIVVIDNGAVVETGTHAELLARRGAYFHLYNEQLHGLSAPVAEREANRA